MRKLLLLFIATTGFVFGQGTLNSTLTVLDNQGVGMQNTEVSLVEMGSRKEYKQKTNANGVVDFQNILGNYFQINILEIKNYYFWQMEVEDGRKLTVKKTLTYDCKNYLRETRPTVDRTPLNLQPIPMNVFEGEKPTVTEAIATLKVVKEDGKTAQPNIPIAMTCFKIGKTFTSSTNQNGNAIFRVPIDNEYQIDVAGINDFDYTDIPNKQFMTRNRTIVYEPTTIQESDKNDTIRQVLPASIKGTSDRVAVSLTVKGELFANQPVYLNVIKGNKVYLGTTDNEGKVQFMLPKGKKYKINMDFERDIDGFDLTRNQGIGYKNKSFFYRPIEKLRFPEKFILKPEDLKQDEFISFINKHLPLPKEGESLITHAKFGNAINAQSEQAVLQLSFLSETEDYTKRPPVNIGLVVDRSGSMMGDRIDKLKIALNAFVDLLRADDIVSLVAFDSDFTTLFPAQKMGNEKENIKNIISRIDAGGGTNIFRGLKEGCEQVMKNYKKDRTNRAILLTDGYCGNHPDSSINVSKQFNAKGLECSAVGVGEYFNYALLKQIATIGGGLIEFVGDNQDFKHIFAKELQGACMTIAQDVKVEVIFNKQLLFAQLLGFPIEQKSTGKISLKLKNFYAGLGQLAFIKFTLVNPTQSIENEPVIIKTKFYDYRKKTTVTNETKAFLSWSPATGKLEYLLEREDKMLYATSLIHRAFKIMAESFATSDKEAAKSIIRTTISDMQKLFPDSKEHEINALMKQLANYLEILMLIKN